jgi:predicted O-methyltransferase YrrM
MLFLLTQLQRIKFKLGIDRKNYLLKYAKSQKVNSILEIGVFNGNFAERLLKIVTNNSPKSKIYYLGVDLFAEGFTEAKYISEISLYPQSFSNIQRKLSKFKNVTVELIQGDSVNVLAEIPNNKTFDIIHIDGGHSYDTVLQDWLNVSKLMNHSSAVFFDDYTNSRGVTKGQFGVNEVVDHIDTKIYDVKSSLNRDFFWKNYGLLILRMVKVTLKAKT